RRMRLDAARRCLWMEDLLHHGGDGTPRLEPAVIRFPLAPEVAATIAPAPSASTLQLPASPPEGVQPAPGPPGGGGPLARRARPGCWAPPPPRAPRLRRGPRAGAVRPAGGRGRAGAGRGRAPPAGRKLARARPRRPPGRAPARPERAMKRVLLVSYYSPPIA